MSISSIDTLKPLEWYKTEIAKCYQKIQTLNKEINSALKEYNSLMFKSFASAYTTAKEKDKKRAKELMQSYLEDYKNSLAHFNRLADLSAQRLACLDLLASLKEERKKAYESKPRN